uniref:Peptidase M24 domain-containing protein n=1 Tax=Trichuris muris TaxID=70415 RepID=A0A5S6QJK6_TRIMR
MEMLWCRLDLFSKVRRLWTVGASTIALNWMLVHSVNSAELFISCGDEFYQPILEAHSQLGLVIDGKVTEMVKKTVADKICTVVVKSVEIMKESGRNKLLVADCIAALKKLKIEPIFGHQFEEGHGYHYDSSSGCFYPNDTIVVDLRSIIYPHDEG